MAIAATLAAHNLSRADPAICATSRHWVFWRMTLQRSAAGGLKDHYRTSPTSARSFVAHKLYYSNSISGPFLVIPSRLWPCRGINAKRLVVPGEMCAARTAERKILKG